MKMENTYRLTDRDIRLMIQLRASNEAIFTGRRNSAMRGWKAIRREMGLQGTMSARQLKKKWDNLKERYRGLKNPPEGMETLTQPSSWRWFHLMDEAITGRLAGTATILKPSLLDEDEDYRPPSTPVMLSSEGAAFSELDVAEMGPLEDEGTFGDVLELSGVEACGKVEAENKTEFPPQVISAAGDGGHLRIPESQSRPVINNSQPVFYATLLPNYTAETNRTPPSSRDVVREAVEVDRKLAELQSERQALEREQAEFDRELIALEKDRELLSRDMATLERDRTSLDRDRAAVERDRAALERDRAAVERDRVCLDRDRAFLDRDRAFLERDRVFVERAREDLERERALWRREREGEAVNGHAADMTTEKEVVLQTRFYQSLTAADLDQDQLETRQRLVSLFQKLVEKL
uniref:uncharacterized protein n=1 Tax=Semicossyphus pulcher TaxID=241346 RepID=UPI0037E73010